MKKSTIILIIAGILLIIGVVVFIASAHTKTTTTPAAGPDGSKKADATPAAKPAESSQSLWQRATSALNKLISSADRSKPIKEGSTGAEVSTLQDSLGQAGQAITVNGTWDADTTAAYNDQCKAWGVTPIQPVTLDQFDTFATMAAITKTGPTGA